jgi:Na+-translocating ferredoxin:NAD+ oxidoreductase RNF subunit RnfB
VCRDNWRAPARFAERAIFTFGKRASHSTAAVLPIHRDENMPRPNPNSFTRRAWLESLLKPVKNAAQAAAVPQPAPVIPAPTPLAANQEKQVAIIAGRFCLAYQETPCTVCCQVCPVPGAIQVESGLPSVVPATCTGCNLCHDACPSPDRAIRMVPAPTRS